MEGVAKYIHLNTKLPHPVNWQSDTPATIRDIFFHPTLHQYARPHIFTLVPKKVLQVLQRSYRSSKGPIGLPCVP